MSAQKSVCINGNPKSGPIRYICYPSNEFSQGKWELSVGGVVFDSSKTISQTLTISCNFITSKQRTTTGESNVYEQPLNTFHLKTNASAPRGIFRFCEYCF